MKIAKKQLETVFNFLKHPIRISSGPFGCGKTVADAIALGYWCKCVPPVKGNAYILLVGRTLSSVKSNICNNLTTFWGNDFKYDTSKKDGYSKDATLFGHRIRLIGLNDSTAAERLQGCNAYLIVGDEVATWSKENFEKVIARLRCDTCPWNTGIMPFVGSCNPDAPNHWLKVLIDQEDSPIYYEEWHETDREDEAARSYYDNLRRLYAYNKAFLDRYVYGKWTVADGLVYTQFNIKKHVYYKDDEHAFETAFYKYYKVGIDFGTTNNTSILLIGVMPAGEQVVLREDILNDTALTEVCQHIIAMCYSVGLDKIRGVYYDPAAKHLERQLKECGFPMSKIRKADNSVIPGIEYVASLLTDDMLIVSHKCKNVIDEFLSYSWGTRPGEVVKKENDHSMDALRYGLYSDFLGK